MSRVLYVAAAMLAAIALHAQGATTQATIAGCLQRAPSSLLKDGQFVLMNASPSPLGGPAQSDATPPPPPPPSKEPIERRPGQSEARQETGGVSYLLQGGRDLESKIGQRVEVTGTIGDEVHVAPTRPTLKRPMRKVQVARIRAIAPTCHAPQP